MARPQRSLFPSKKTKKGGCKPAQTTIAEWSTTGAQSCPVLRLWVGWRSRGSEACLFCIHTGHLKLAMPQFVFRGIMPLTWPRSGAVKQGSGKCWGENTPRRSTHGVGIFHSHISMLFQRSKTSFCLLLPRVRFKLDINTTTSHRISLLL